MRIIYAALLAMLVGCRSEREPETPPVPPVTSSAGIAEVARDTVGSGAAADSLLDLRTEDSPGVPDSPDIAVTPNGDTLIHYGAVIIHADSVSTVALEVYSWNRIGYARIARLSGRKEDGRAIWSTRARSIVPGVESARVVRECRVGERADPFVFGTLSDVVNMATRSPLRAWRFDPETETLSEVSPADVRCSQVLGFEH